MHIRGQFERIVKNLRRSHEWNKMLKSANDLLYQGQEKLGQAVKEYGKILEILLRDLFKEVNMVIAPGKEDKNPRNRAGDRKGKKTHRRIWFWSTDSILFKI